MIYEVQIRSKLQNAWSEFTHELHCKIPTEYQADNDTAIARIARNLVVENNSALVVRDTLQRLADKTELDDFRKD